MANDKHANVDEVISANKIRLVVKDAYSDKDANSDSGSVPASDLSDSSLAAVSDIASPRINSAPRFTNPTEERVESEYQFKILDHRLTFHGICSECQAKGK